MGLNIAPITWKETSSRITEDRRRLRDIMADDLGRSPTLLVLHPSFLCVFLFRVARYLAGRGRRHMARLIWLINILLTGCDIATSSDIGAGCVIVHPAGVTFAGRAGRNLTIVALAGVGGEVGRRTDLGPGPGFAVLGDDVRLEACTGVLGPVRIGDRVRVMPGAVVTRDVDAGCVVHGHAPRVLRVGDAP